MPYQPGSFTLISHQLSTERCCKETAPWAGNYALACPGGCHSHTQRRAAQALLAARVRSDGRIHQQDKCLTPASAGLPAAAACCSSCCRAGLLTTARSAEPGKLPTSASPKPTTSSMYTSSLFPASRHSVHLDFVPCEQAQCKSCLFPCEQAQAEWCKSLQSGVRSSLSHT